MWIVILISFITYGIWQLVQMPYFFLKTFLRKHYRFFRAVVVSNEEEVFHGRFDITRRPTGFPTSYDYFMYAKPLVMRSQSNPSSLYYAYGALKFLLNQSLTLTYGYRKDGSPITASRSETHNALIFPLHLTYFTRIGCQKVQFECNRLREIVVRLGLGRDEGFFNGNESVGFSDAINIGLEGESPSWTGHVSKGIIACAIFAVLESKCVLKKDKRRMKWVYRILKSRNILASIYPLMGNKHKTEDLEALVASYEVLLDYDNNLFYRIGYRNLMKVYEETKCSLVQKNIPQSKEVLKHQLSR